MWSNACTVGVLGTGTMGAGIVQVAAQSGYAVVACDRAVEALITSFGKLPVVIHKDVPGFVANRFLMPIMIEAARLLEEGVATKEDIDLLAKKALGFPVGPFELGDLIGHDVSVDMMS